ncbi:hypothetical protein Q7P37_006309 [Cladosporium fusiforme]
MHRNNIPQALTSLPAGLEMALASDKQTVQNEKETVQADKEAVQAEPKVISQADKETISQAEKEALESTVLHRPSKVRRISSLKSRLCTSLLYTIELRNDRQTGSYEKAASYYWHFLGALIRSVYEREHTTALSRTAGAAIMPSAPSPSIHRAAASGDEPYVHPAPLRGNRSSVRLLTELSRERIALRHLHAWTALYKPEYIDRHAFSPDRPLPTPAACHDTGLAAFAQLAALRIGVRRAFVTLISRDTEYVLVESTRSMSLQSDFTSDAKDKSWLGTSCFKRAEGINGLALDGWRKARRYRERPESSNYYYTEGMSDHWCIISDVGQNAKFLNLPLVSRAERPRFYFSVPLRDAEGAVIGSLTMLDDKPRYGVSADEMLFAEDLNDSIAQHLFGSTVTSQRQRSERLIQALGTFNNGGSSLRDWWAGQDNMGVGTGGWHKRADESDAHQQARFDTEFGVGEDRSVESTASPFTKDTRTTRPTPARTPRSASDGNDQATLERNEQHISGLDFGKQASASIQASAEPPKASTQERKKEGKDEFDAASQVKQVYRRASNLLRESLGSAGVVFFDATASSVARPLKYRNSRSLSSDQASSSSSIRTASTSSDDSKTQTNSDTDLSDNAARRSKRCEVVGASTQVQSSNSTINHSPFQLSEKDLARLIKCYPAGKVFSYTVSGTAYSGSEESAGSESTGTDTIAARANTKHSRHARILRKVVGDARSIAFFPIWDATHERYRSGLFTWTLHANRFFDSNEDLTYLAAFGHSLRAEIGRIETVASDAAKGRFISSVSHELRSPLHGVLAGIELLQDSRLTPFQEEMALSVSLAGRTLLDTVNHILDYSRISNLTKDQKTERARVDAARHMSATMNDSQSHNMIDVDLARLTEEVVESVVSAYRYSRAFEQSESNGSASRKGSISEPEKWDVSVTLDIDKRASWTTPMAPGSWTRVLTNIVGNALKYTLNGTVSVKLAAKERTSTRNGGTTVCLWVEDTGIGMSKEFVSNDLFTPFRQADSHSAGTGLGLSIVREVSKEFNASVNVESEPGKGTTVSVQFAATFTDQPNTEDDDPEDSPTSKPRQLRLLNMDDSPPQHTAFGTNIVKDSMQRTAAQWLGCEIVTSRGMTPDARGSFYVVSENDLFYLHSLGADAVKSFIASLAAGGSRLLILGHSIATAQPAFEFEDFTVKPIYIHQPIGPRKLMRAIANARSSVMTRQTSDYALYNTRAQTPSRIIKGDTPEIKPGDPEKTGSYFDLSRSQGGQHARTSSNLITPVSFMEASSAQTPETPSTPVATAAQQQEADHILLVEDNTINMRLLTALMRKQGLAYECATNGLEALNAYKAAPLRFYLILMDMSMPIMDGFESTAKIREFERRSKIRPGNIAALTGVTSEGARTDAYNAGVNKYLTKPIQMGDLKKLVAETRGSLKE